MRLIYMIFFVRNETDSWNLGTNIPRLNTRRCARWGTEIVIRGLRFLSVTQCSTRNISLLDLKVDLFHGFHVHI
jgi:hypothetical protein